MKKLKSLEDVIRQKYEYMDLPFFEFDSGWNKLVEELCEKIAKIDKNKEVRVQQIKEKFASLRFYINSGTDKIYKLIAKYEKISSKTCEICGNEGHIRTLKDHRWYKTLCDRHAKKLGYIDISKKPKQKSTTRYTNI
jgi:hypothetical protein